jgi:competence protein ComEC
MVLAALAVVVGIGLDRSLVGRFASGRLADLLQPVAPEAWWCASAVCTVVWWTLWRAQRNRSAAWLLLAAVALTGATWHDLRWFVFSRDDIGRYAPPDAGPACITASVLRVPENLPEPRPNPLRAIPGNTRSRIDVEATAIRDGKDWLSAAGRCELLVDGDVLGVYAGDTIQTFGQLERPSPPLNPGEFDFAANARSERRLAMLRTDSPSAVTVLFASTGWSVRRALDLVRTGGIQTLHTFLQPKQAELAAAMLLGARDALPLEETTPFFLSGTIHLLVISGLHVGILAMGLYAALGLGWIPRRTALAAIILVVVVYALVAGARPSVLRAAVLVTLVCVGAWSGRRSAGFNSLAAAAIIILAINPCELFRAGSQLSFLCVATLIWSHGLLAAPLRMSDDPLDRLIAASRHWSIRFAKSIGRWAIWLLLTTAIVWVIALPLVLYRFHVVTPIALLISPLVWVVTLVVMWSGYLTLLCGTLIPTLAGAIGTLCSSSLAALEGLVNWAATIRFGHFWTAGPAGWWVLGFYLALAACVVWGRARIPWRWQIAVACTWILVGLTPAVACACLRDDTLRASFVAVGHGTCVVLQSPDDETILYDAGTSGSPEFGSETIAGFLWDRGITRIDSIILSHADTDHYNAVPGLLDRFHVGTVFVSPVMFDSYDPEQPAGGPAALHQAIEAARVPIREIWAGDRLRVGPEVVFNVLHPPQRGVIGTDNANSVTLGVEYRGKKMLLPGDLESPGLDDLLAEEPYDCDVLMAPHHGSRRSDPPGFAAWCTPEWVVFSGDSRVPVDVERTYEKAGARVFTTGKSGAIDVALGDAGVAVSPWLDSPIH